MKDTLGTYFVESKILKSSFKCRDGLAGVTTRNWQCGQSELGLILEPRNGPG